MAGKWLKQLGLFKLTRSLWVVSSTIQQRNFRLVVTSSCVPSWLGVCVVSCLFNDKNRCCHGWKQWAKREKKVYMHALFFLPIRLLLAHVYSWWENIIRPISIFAPTNIMGLTIIVVPLGENLLFILNFALHINGGSFGTAINGLFGAKTDRNLCVEEIFHQRIKYRHVYLNQKRECSKRWTKCIIFIKKILSG